jgi:nitroreductase
LPQFQYFSVLENTYKFIFCKPSPNKKIVVFNKINKKNMDYSNQFDEIVKRRRSVRIYDSDAFFDEKAVERSLERAVLAPNSSNMQLWEFYRVKNKEVKLKLVHACMQQSAAKTANELIVFVTKQSKWKQHAQWNFNNISKQFEGKELTNKEKRALAYYSKLMPLFYRNDFFGINTLIRKIVIGYMGFNKPILRLIDHTDQRIMCHKSVALAAQTFMLSMTAEGYDTCPMEGFDKFEVKKTLKLGPTDEITMIVACGKGKPEGIYAERTRLPNEEVIFIV